MNKPLRQSSMDVIKNLANIYDKTNGILGIRKSNAAKCFKYTNDLLLGSICGVCQKDYSTRYVGTDKSIDGKVQKEWKVRFLATEAKAWATACGDYLKSQMTLFKTMTSISILFNVNDDMKMVSQHAIVLDSTTLGTEYEEKT